MSQSLSDAKPGSVQSELKYVRNESGTRLGLTYFPAFSVIKDNPMVAEGTEQNQSAPKPVLLAHGTFSNHRSCKGLAQYLSKRGFDCWILDFQGHGHSDKPSQKPDFESMCVEDAHAAIQFLQEQYPDEAVHWVGHSGGGLALFMYLARYPEQQSVIGRAVTLASQATHAGINPRNRLAIRISAIITRILNVAPGRWFKIGPENEFAAVMLQWYKWSLTGKWLGSDGFNYEHALSSFHRPLLGLAASGDTFIAPTSGCRHVFDSCASEQKIFRVCGLSSGYREDYTHARLISSSAAAKEIWPMVADWLESEPPTEF